MISKVLISVDDTNYIEDYRKVGISTFLFPLKGYCVGYNTYSLDDILKIEVSNKYILINRVLDCDSVDKLKKLLKDLKGIKGIVFEDIAFYMIVKELGLNVEMILFQNHFQTNSQSVNFWLDRVDSLMLSNEMTKDELCKIVNDVKRKVCVHLYGYNQVMYSRRLLLSNWSEEFQIPYKNSNVIIDRATKVKFNAIENEFGTVMYSGNIFNGRELLGMDNVLYYYVNPMLIKHEIVMDFLTDMENHSDVMEDNGFLEKETIYKLKEVPR